MNRNKRWYYGWNIVITSSIITLVTQGFRMSIGPFFLPLLNDFDITRTIMSSIVSISMFTYGLGMPLAGYLESRLGPKKILVLGALINLGASIWMINTHSVIGLYLSFGVFISFGLAFMSQTTLTPVITRWFKKRRGQALLYLSTGSMAGIALMNPLVSTLINQLSWRGTIITISVFITIIVSLIAFFVIRLNAPSNDEGDANNNLQDHKLDGVVSSVASISLKESVKTPVFWYICIGLFACGYSMNLIGSHGVPMLVDNGFSSSVASMAIGFIGLVAIPGTITMASFSDSISKKYLLSLIYVTRGIGIILFVFVVFTFQLYLVALVAGIAWAGNTSLSSAILSNVYGVRLVGILYGFAYFLHQLGGTISTFIGGWAYEQFEVHWISFGSASMFLFIAGLISLKILNKPLTNKKSKNIVTNPISN